MQPTHSKNHRYLDDAKVHSPPKRVKLSPTKENELYDDHIVVSKRNLRQSPSAKVPQGKIPPLRLDKTLSYVNRMVKGAAEIIKRTPPPKTQRTLVGKISEKSLVEETRKSNKRISLTMKKMIGSGFFGNVWYAKMKESRLLDPSLFSLDQQEIIPKKKVAVKGFDNDYDRELAVVENLIADNPPGVLRIHGIMHYGIADQPHLVMKFCNGGTAHDFLYWNVDNKRACYGKVIEMMGALRSLHQAGYCHRDIHEKNFLTHVKIKTGEESLYLLDFGHAARLTPGVKEIKPMRSRAIYMLNSPRIVKQMYDEAQQSNNYVAYGQYLDAHAMEIDGYQAGMMLFRVAVATRQFPLLPAMDNPLQRQLVETIDLSFNDPAHPFDAYQYLAHNHPEIPEEVALVIAGLLTQEPTMPLDQAIDALKSYIERA
ncbi:MAG: protein kinase domain-containing protein [Parachlamydiaceae bacterium]